jgi:hypothetical protein
MTDVQAILREIVNDLEKTAAGLAVLSARVHELRPTPGYQTQDEVSVAAQTNRKYYDKLRKKIDELT